MSKVFSYIVARDYGFAPNPFYGVLTLATCKPVIRKTASIGDFIIGCSNKALGNKLIYMAKVSEILTFDQYWNDPRFAKKNHHDADGNWMQEDSHHTNNDGTINPNNLKRDTSTTDKILVCNDFVYLGKSMINVPDEYDSCIYKGRGFYYVAYDDAKKLWDYLLAQYPGGGKIDQPNLFKVFKRYDGIS